MRPTFINSFLALLSVAVSWLPQKPSGASEQRLYVVGVPAQMDTVTAQEVLKATLKLLLSARPGARIIVIDAYGMRKISECSIAEGKPSARAGHLRDSIAALKEHFDKTSSVRAQEQNQVRTPQFLELVGSTLKPASGSTVVVMFSRPYYEDPRDEAFVFHGDKYPSDGYYLTDSRNSIYGTADRRNLLQGTVVHWSYLSETFPTGLARTHVRRFWKCYLDRLGSVLSTFERDPNVVLDRALAGVNDPVSKDTADEADTVLEMRSIAVGMESSTPPTDAHTERASDQSPGGRLPDPAPIGSGGAEIQVPVSPKEAVERVARALPTATGRVDIAVIWTTDNPDARRADVDLYVRPPDSTVELNFRETRTADGRSRHVRDVRSAPTLVDESLWSTTWEVVELDGATSVERATCWLNLYAGTNSAITGIVRVAVGEEVRVAHFSFPAGPGNRAADRQTRENSPNWRHIDLASLFR